MIEKGICHPSQSVWASPLQMVPKEDRREFRLSGDYRSLNAVATFESYPVTHILDFSNELDGRRVFSKVDLVRAYHKIPVHPDDIQKTAITTLFNLYELVCIPFGLANASQTFQRFVYVTLRGLKRTVAYLDDILIASDEEELHLRDLKKVFQRLIEARLRIDPAKSVFGVSEMIFLGLSIGRDGTKQSSEKIKALQRFGRPKTVGLRRFLGMLNYYSRNLRGAAQFQITFTDLLKECASKQNGKKEIIWTEEASSAFEECKRRVAQKVVLAYSDPDTALALYTEASSRAVGAVLGQVVFEKGERVVQSLALYSAKLSETE